MVEIDYILDVDALRVGCQRQDLLTDYTLPEREMLMRLRVGDTEVFGHTEEEYEGWMRALKSNNISLHVPSSDWSLLSVLSIAAAIDDAFKRLGEGKGANIDSLDCVIRMTRQDDIVTVCIDRNHCGRASFTEMYTAFTAFAKRVRRDFLLICPQLRNHVTLGHWFKGEPELTSREGSQDVISLPGMGDHLSRGSTT